MNNEENFSELMHIIFRPYSHLLLKTLIDKFDFFNKFGEDALNEEQIRKKFGFTNRSIKLIISLLLNYNLLEEKNGKFILSGLASRCLKKYSPEDVSSFVGLSKVYRKGIFNDIHKNITENISLVWDNKKKWENSMQEKKSGEEFLKVMDSRALHLADSLSEKLDLKGTKNLLDIGGSSGLYSCKFAEKNPSLKAIVLDQPRVTDAAQKLINERGFKDKVEVMTADMFKYPFPESDAHFYSHVLHDWDEETCLKLLKKSFKYLPKKGKVIIHGAFLEDSSGPRELIEHSIHLMFFTHGRHYSVEEMVNLMKKAGFKDIFITSTVMFRKAIVGVKK